MIFKKVFKKKYKYHKQHNIKWLTVSQIEGWNIRITKNPEERKKELIGIAEQLFIKKGYEQTAVSDIVKKSKSSTGYFLLLFQDKRRNSRFNNW